MPEAGTQDQDAVASPPVSEETLRRAQAANERRAQAKDVEAEELTARDSVVRSAEGKRLTVEQSSDALDWFLSDDPAEHDPTHKLRVNVGTPDKPRDIDWVIKAVDLDTLREIRRQATGTRAQRRSGGDIDDIQINLQIVVEGTVYPDLREASQQVRLPGGGRGIADPTTALRMKFQRKPGLLGQIAAEIMSLSGYDDEDVRDAPEVEAGKG